MRASLTLAIIQVENPESYNFRPKDMLAEICLAMVHFADCNPFHNACATSGYYSDELLPKVGRTRVLICDNVTLVKRAR